MKLAFCVLAGWAALAATSAPAATLVLDGKVQTYRAPDNSRNYTEASQVWSNNTAVIGVANGFTAPPSFNGRFAATIEFAFNALPADAIVTAATLSLAPEFWNDSIATMKFYTASSIVADVSRATAGTFITAFDLQDLYPANPRPEFTVTSSVKSAVAGVASNPIIGFSFEQVVDRCVRTQGFDCISTLGNSKTPGGNDRYPLLTITYDVPSTPPETPAVPEPATWAMMIAGFGAIGASLRRRRSFART